MTNNLLQLLLLLCLDSGWDIVALVMIGKFCNCITGTLMYISTQEIISRIGSVIGAYAVLLVSSNKLGAVQKCQGFYL